MITKLEQRSALVIAFMLFLWTILMYLTGFHTENIRWQGIVAAISFIFPFIGIFWAVSHKRDKVYFGTINFLQAFLTGTIITVIFSLINPLLMWVYVTVINPSFFRAQIEFDRSRILLEVATENQTQYLTESAEHFTLFPFLLSGLIISLVSGLIISLIVALAVKKVKA
jgi:hypothetical protein